MGYKRNQTSFAAGEMSPSLEGRVDIQKYHLGASYLNNMFVRQGGGVSNRPGMAFIDYGVGDGRLIPFQYTTSTAYVLEFTDGIMRVLYNGGFITVDLVDSGSNYTWTLSGSGTGEYYLLDNGGDPGLVEPVMIREDGVRMVKSTVGTLATGEFAWGDNDTLGFDTVYVRIDGSTDPSLEADGYLNTSLQIVSPFSLADLDALTYAQDGGTMYLAHPDYAPRKLVRGATAEDWTSGAALLGANVTGENVQSSAVAPRTSFLGA